MSATERRRLAKGGFYRRKLSASIIVFGLAGLATRREYRCQDDEGAAGNLGRGDLLVQDHRRDAGIPDGLEGVEHVGGARRDRGLAIGLGPGREGRRDESIPQHDEQERLRLWRRDRAGPAEGPAVDRAAGREGEDGEGAVAELRTGLGARERERLDRAGVLAQPYHVCRVQQRRGRHQPVADEHAAAHGPAAVSKERLAADDGEPRGGGAARGPQPRRELPAEQEGLRQRHQDRRELHQEAGDRGVGALQPLQLQRLPEEEPKPELGTRTQRGHVEGGALLLLLLVNSAIACALLQHTRQQQASEGDGLEQGLQHRRWRHVWQRVGELDGRTVRAPRERHGDERSHPARIAGALLLVLGWRLHPQHRRT
eukprot:scaffold37411_cov75-Phaeocystis_antarctica.AAC.6